MPLFEQNFLNMEEIGAPYFRTIHDKESNLTLVLLVKRFPVLDQYKLPFGLKWFHTKEVELLSIGPCDEMLTLLSSVGISVDIFRFHMNNSKFVENLIVFIEI